MQVNLKKAVDRRANANLPKGGSLGMAMDRKAGTSVFIYKPLINAANVTYYKYKGDLLTNEQITKLALEYFAENFGKTTVAGIQATKK